MKLEAGSLAPDFSLYDSEKNNVRLSELRGGNVLLLFFPAAFSSTCTKELCSIRDNMSHYVGLKAKVMAISVDMVYSLAKYKEVQNLKFSLLSDFNKEVSTAYGCLYDKFNFNMKGVSKRAAFIVDRQGRVRYAEVLEIADELPDFQAIQRILSDLK